MTERLNKRFKEILTEMNDPDMDPQEIVSPKPQQGVCWKNLLTWTSSILWGYTSKDSIDILEKFFPDDKDAGEQK